jgi:predicted TPR repeat methyltransferase
MGDWKKAAGAYQQAAADPGPEQARAELGVARMLAKSGDKQGAIAAYRGFLNAHPFAQQRQDVIESLAMLGAPADVSPIPSAPGVPQQVLIH